MINLDPDPMKAMLDQRPVLPAVLDQQDPLAAKQELKLRRMSAPLPDSTV